MVVKIIDDFKIQYKFRLMDHVQEVLLNQQVTC